MSTDWSGVPEPTIVLFGAQVGWSGDRESVPKSRCRNHPPIRDGQRVYCASCHGTGHDATLAFARDRAQATPVPERDRERPRLRKRDVRELMRSREGRAWLREQGYLDEHGDGSGPEADGAD
jgi:hypothetical protein